jgi:hypothetical protein
MLIRGTIRSETLTGVCRGEEVLEPPRRRRAHARTECPPDGTEDTPMAGTRTFAADLEARTGPAAAAAAAAASRQARTTTSLNFVGKL